MKICPQTSLLCFLLIMAFIETPKALFLQYPKRALMNFLETLGGHKEAKPVHHYHMHYYPVPVIVPKPVLPPPPKIEIDLSSLHSSSHSSGHDQLRSLSSWPSQEQQLVLPSSHSDGQSWSLNSLPEAWPDLYQQKSWNAWDNNEILDKDHQYKEHKSPGFLLQLPSLHQQIVFYQPPAKDKPSLLTIFLKKLRRLNDALLHPEEENSGHHDSPHITNSLTYASSSSSSSASY